MYKGDLEGFPKEVVEKMLDRQVEHGNKRDVAVFEESYAQPGDCGGFYWIDTIEGCGFWSKVLSKKNFDLFFEKHPKEEPNSKPISNALQLNKPKRYSSREVAGMDVIDLVKHWNLDFNEGNILKYLLRDKGEDIQDLEKIIDYAQRQLQFKRNEQGNTTDKGN